MNRQLPIAVLVLALAARAQAPQAFTVEESLSVRVPVRAMVEPMLREVLSTHSVQEALRDALVAAVPREAQVVSCDTPTFFVTVVDPEAHAIVRLQFAGEATARVVHTETTCEAVAKVLSQRLDSLLFDPAVADAARELDIFGQRLTVRQKQLADAEERDALLGSDTDRVPGTAIAELRERTLSLEVAERTEQDVSKGLADRLADSQKQLGAAEEQLRGLVMLLSANEAQLADPQNHDNLGATRTLIDSLRAQVRSAEAEHKRAAETTTTLQQQIVVNSENLHRVAAERQNLELQLQKCQREVDATHNLRFQRTALRREIAACEREVATLQQAMAEAQLRRDKLRPVEVRSWQ